MINLYSLLFLDNSKFISPLLNGIIEGMLIISAIIWTGNYLTNKKRKYLLLIAINNICAVIFIQNIIPQVSWAIFIAGTVYLFLSFGEIKEFEVSITKWYFRFSLILFIFSICFPIFSHNYYINKSFFILLALWFFSHLLIWAKVWNKNDVFKVGFFSYLFGIIGGIIEILRNANILPDNYFTCNAFAVGVGINTIITLLTFINFVNHLQKTKKIAQLEKEKLMQEQNTMLEQMVEKRTKDLEIRSLELENEKHKSDELLLNILPKETAEELKQFGLSKPKAYGMVTVMFTDFKDFSIVSEKVSPELLVAEIDYCFSGFDLIIKKYKIEKIKTVGDAYICAAGMPELTFTHSADAVNAALEIRGFMLNRKMEKEARGEIPFEIRIGIHTGSLVAGVVGKNKFAYDIWGDTVNIAARMEQNSEAGKINISGTTFELVKNKFMCEYRGKLFAKNKGEIDMYFVENA